MIVFSPFRLDPGEQRLWRGNALVHLKPMALALLQHLAGNAGKLITREELLARFWGGVHIGDGVLKTHVAEIRQALGDSARAPRFIETVHGRGYRFIGRSQPAGAGVSEASPAVALGSDGADASERASPFRVASTLPVVGRRRELDRLAACWVKARRGERQVVFVSGEAGIGKSALVNAFASDRLASAPDVRVMWGQCVDQCGAGEPYLPILEAMRRCPEGSALLRDVERLLDEKAPSVNPNRLLRALAEALEELAVRNCVALLVEDLHWADSPTLDLLAYLAQRSDRARLLVVATYRPLEARASRLADIEQTLSGRGKCFLLSVPALGERAVREYLDERFRGHELPPAVSAVLHRSTAGNPLFMMGVVDEWVERGLLETGEGPCRLTASSGELARCVPGSFVRMVHRALERVSALERRVLEAASVAGNGFSTAAVAAALSLETVEVEEICLRWARRGQFFRLGGKAEWRDGTVAERCEFVHALHQQIIYEQIGAARQAQLHLRIAERLEAARGDRAEGNATELALHFERGRDHARAVRYLRLSGEHALRQGAHHAAVGHLSHALELVPRLPSSEAPRAVELELCCLLASPLRVTRGAAASEVQRLYERAAQLCDEGCPARKSFVVMAGKGGVHLLRGESKVAFELGEKFLKAAEREGDAGALSEAHLVLGVAHHLLGEHLLAHSHLERVLHTHDSCVQAEHVSLAGRHPVVAAQCFIALSSCWMGYLDTGRRQVEEAVSLARELDDPFALAFGFHFAAEVCRVRGEHEAAQNHLDALAALSARYGFGFFSAGAMLQEGGARILSGQAAAGIELLERGLIEREAAGVRLYAPHWSCLLAEGYAAIGRAERALRLIDDALAEARESGERLWDSELLRTRAAIVLNRRESDGAHEAPGATGERNGCIEGDLLLALEVARERRAKLFELRAAVQLGRYWQARGQEAQAHVLLSSLYTWFTEGLDTTELIEARLLLQELDRDRAPVSQGVGVRAG